MELSDGPMWRDIHGYNSKYQVSYFGEFRRVYKSGKTRAMTPHLKTKPNGSKRLVVKLTINSKSKDVMAHQIVAETFIGACPDGYVPYHKNGLYKDNIATNIEYISKSKLGKLTGSQSFSTGCR